MQPAVTPRARGRIPRANGKPQPAAQSGTRFSHVSLGPESPARASAQRSGRPRATAGRARPRRPLLLLRAARGAARRLTRAALLPGRRSVSATAPACLRQAPAAQGRCLRGALQGRSAYSFHSQRSLRSAQYIPRMMGGRRRPPGRMDAGSTRDDGCPPTPQGSVRRPASGSRTPARRRSARLAPLRPLGLLRRARPISRRPCPRCRRHHHRDMQRRACAPPLSAPADARAVPPNCHSRARRAGLAGVARSAAAGRAAPSTDHRQPRPRPGRIHGPGCGPHSRARYRPPAAGLPQPNCATRSRAGRSRTAQIRVVGQAAAAAAAPGGTAAQGG